jgi:hypothetical protein
MSNTTIIIVIIILLTVVFFHICNTEYEKETFGGQTFNSDVGAMYEVISKDDSEYFAQFSTKNQIFTKLINNNLLSIPTEKKNKILFITFDNRNADYITLHNKNITSYTNKWEYNYEFITTCDYNVYWCKIQFILDALETNKYDYVIWLDSDTIIRKQYIDIGKILNKYSSDIFVGSDNTIKHDLINAGVLIIKNTEIGKEFMRNCIRNVKRICFNSDGTLKGIWAATCYEQGQLNLLIAAKYYDKTTVLPNDIVFNYGTCIENSFIMHLYGGSEKKRRDCFITAEEWQI